MKVNFYIDVTTAIFSHAVLLVSPPRKGELVCIPAAGRAEFDGWWEVSEVRWTFETPDHEDFVDVTLKRRRGRS